MSNLYRIGAVARLTGIPTDTLRIWERRYTVVTPERTDKGGRLYSQEDVSRLTLIKTLVDQGHAISTVARLDSNNLRARLSNNAENQTVTAPENSVTVVTLGEALSLRLQHSQIPENIEIIASYDGLNAAPETLPNCNIVFAELPFLDPQTPQQLQPLKQYCSKLVVVYAFSPKTIVQQLNRLGIITEQAPVSAQRLWQHALLPFSTKPEPTLHNLQPEVVNNEPVPARRFSSKQLALLSDVTTTLKCECPHHMSSVIETLIAFEEYCLRCENLTTKDAALHAYLHSMTAKSRWIMEIALEKLAEAEGIDVNDSP